MARNTAFFLYVDGQACEAEPRYRTARANQVDEADFAQGVADGDVDALPGVAYAADLCDIAVTVRCAALGDRHRALKGIDDFRGADGAGVTSERIATIRAPSRSYESVTGQRFQQFARRGQGNPGA